MKKLPKKSRRWGPSEEGPEHLSARLPLHRAYPKGIPVGLSGAVFRAATRQHHRCAVGEGVGWCTSTVDGSCADAESECEVSGRGSACGEGRGLRQSAP